MFQSPFSLRCLVVRSLPFSAADKQIQHHHGLDEEAVLGSGLQQVFDPVSLGREQQHAAHGQCEHGGRQRGQQTVVARQSAPLDAAERHPAADGEHAHRQPAVQGGRDGGRHGPSWGHGWLEWSVLSAVETSGREFGELSIAFDMKKQIPIY